MLYVGIGLSIAILVILGMILRRLDRIGAYIAEQAAIEKAQAIQNMLRSLAVITPDTPHSNVFRDMWCAPATALPTPGIDGAHDEEPGESSALRVAGLRALLQHLVG